MPKHTQAILQTGKIEFVVGDMSQPNFGVEDSVLERMQNEVTLVIHTAAKIALDADIGEAIRNNCLPCLEIARIVSRFRRLKIFVQLSTAYVNSFLPDGYVGERLYNVSDEDPEDELSSIMSSGMSPHTALFSSSYAQAKYLMERLLLRRYPQLPLLLVRPTIFGPALRHPYPLYGPENSTPMDKFARFYFADVGGTQIWHATEGYTSGANILDEIPVDYVANACLLHAAARTTGIVHIGSELYVQRTFDEFLHVTQTSAPPAVRRNLPEILFTEDRNVPQCFLAELVKVATRDWRFDCGRSYWMKLVAGPLNLSACRKEIDDVSAIRVQDTYRKHAADYAKL